ncbi:bifunctional 2-polyprenyl-6-hydroxyphenol methylase/3-demethylubiquinol 3-O-methyltransferase UbiG [Bordetella sp. LUAb4]|uniref:class I SAM-dependent methyltransferase n=1 Tax=Bordetella sp. LUAb4 TaxID=2843195 RepID=UPI001E3B44ED|nr:class I SAM-dependent methyltransferase [Bordetella sp. LUAb4]
MTLNIADDYWRRFAGAKENRLAAKRRAEIITQTCGWGHVLDIGCGDGALVRELIEQGFVAEGIDSSEIAIEYARSHSRASFAREDISALSASAASVDIISISDVLENLDESEIGGALAELRRVTKNYLVAWITCEGRAQTRRPRAWWESRLLDAGFRIGLRAFNVPVGEICRGVSREILVMEKCPQPARFSRNSEAVGDLTTWPTKISGASLRRRHIAAQFIREGDRALDISCGTGWGAHILAANSLASEVIGIEADEQAIRYAENGFSPIKRLAFVCETSIQYLNRTPDMAVDFIFDTEGQSAQFEFLQECCRVLSPGGRIFVLTNGNQRATVGNFDWVRSGGFFIEHTFLGLDAPPSAEASEIESDVVPILLAKDPILGWGTKVQREVNPYVLEQKSPPLLHFNAQYENPWLIRNMVSIGIRSFNPKLLDILATRVIESNNGVNDIAAATCVRAYAFLEAGDRPLTEFAPILNEIDASLLDLNGKKADAAAYPRWQISLHYVKALIHLSIGERELASENLHACISLPYNDYSILLGTKVAGASFLLGMMRIAEGDIASARQAWQIGLDVGKAATSIRWEREFGQSAIPPDFVFRELTTVLDLATRCSTALLQCRDGTMSALSSLRSVVNKQWMYDKLHQRLLDREAEVEIVAADLQKQNADLAKEILRLDSLSKLKDEQISQLKVLLASIK